MRAGRRSGAKQTADDALVNLAQQIQIIRTDVFIYFVDGGVAWSQFHHLSSCRRNKAAVGSTTGSRSFGFNTIHSANTFPHCGNQGVITGEEGQTRKLPLKSVLQAVTVQNRFSTLTYGRLIEFSGEAEVEHNFQFAGDHVVGTSTTVNIGDLKTGRRKRSIALIPDFMTEFMQAQHGLV